MIIGITGFKTAGKDTAALILKKYGSSFEIVHFADKLKAMALAIDPYVQVPGADNILTFKRLTDVINEHGWDGAKCLSDVRRLLQRLGTEAVRKHLGENTWVKALFNDLEAGKNYIIPDTRFINEAAAIREADGIILRIQRPSVEVSEHASESEQVNMKCDCTIHNDDDIPALEEKLKWVANILIHRVI